MKKRIVLLLMFCLMGCGDGLLEDKEHRLNVLGNHLSGCSHCGDRWTWKEAHSTFYEDGSGMFPLCEECYNKLTYPYVLWYHLKLFEDWKEEPTDKQIEQLSLEISKEKDDNMWAVSGIKEKMYKNGKLKSIYSIE